MTEEEQKLIGAYNAASSRVHDALRMRHGGSKAEAAFGEAYAALVAAGLAPRLKRKYRLGGQAKVVSR